VKKMATQRIRGVALIVQNSEGKILILQEYETKPHFGKYCGMLSIPMETSEPDELDYCAIVRLAKEELPGFSLPLENVLQSHVGIYRIASHVWVNLYFIRTMNTCLQDLGNPKSNEVGNFQWIYPEEALNLWLRQGAWEMIKDFMSNKKGVLCKRCRTPQK